MASILDVGAYIYRERGWVDAWKLEKLAYFAQAWHLAWDGRPLFPDSFEAWRDGPVSPLLHRVNKYDRAAPYSTELPGSNPNGLSESEVAVIDAVLAFYGGRSKDELIELSHVEPWLKARGDCGLHEKCFREVEVSEIRRHYSQRAVAEPELSPQPPALMPASVMAGPMYGAAVASQIDRWSDTLAWLAER